MNAFCMTLRALRTALVALFAAVLLAACGGGGGGETPPPAAATLTGVEISPLNASIPAGTQRAFAATAIYSDNTRSDVTASATFRSGDTSVASIDAAGRATGVRAGSTTITATFEGQMGSTALTVTAAVPRSVAVTPVGASLAKGTSRQYTATATFSDGSTRDVTAMSNWSSSATAIATVGNADAGKGLVTGVSTGSATIGAVFQDLSGSAAVTITAATLSRIDVTPATASIAKGTTQQFVATGVFSDNSTQNLTTSVSWSSSNTTVASVSDSSASKGLATALDLGTASIVATQGTVTGSASLTVTAATLRQLQITPATGSIAKGTTQQFAATGTYTDNSTQDLTTSVVWVSEVPATATISNAAGSNGLASAVAEGNTVIRASAGDIQSNDAALTVTAAVLARIEVTPTAPSIPLGTTRQFTATGVFTDGTTQDYTSSATWASDATDRLEVSNASASKGLSVAKALGEATVSASQAGVTGTTLATVTDATLTAIAVTPPNRRLAKGFSLQYVATGTYSDNSTRDITADVTWATSNASAATISNADGSRGLATATVTPGSTNVTASLSGVSGSTSLTVSNATLSSVAITPTNPSVPKGVSGQSTATGTFSDGTTQDLTEQASWSSSDATKLTVSNTAGSKGRYTAVEAGAVTVTASITNAATTSAVAGTSSFTVTAAALSRIAVTPATASIPKGTVQAFTATGTYTDNSTQDITATVTWSSSATGVATISNAAPDKGQATAVGVGNTTVTAALSGVSSTAALTVTAAVLTAIDVTPKNASVAAGRTQQFVATGTFSDGTTQNLTNSTTWSSATSSVATISNADGSRGLATSSTAGTTNIVATTGSVSSTAVEFTVNDAVPVSMAITPANGTIGNGTSQQFTATETFSDGSTSDVTGTVTWSSSNTAIADISNAAGTQGLATAKSQGTVTITATDASVTPNITATTQLTVGPAALQRITVTGVLTSLPAGYTVQYNASGTYADGSTQDITASVNWSTLNPAVATVSNAAASRGAVTTVAVGSTSVLATLSGVTGSATVAVTNATLSSIAVTPTNPTIAGRDTLQMTATATFSDGGRLDITRQVTWASSNTTNVSVDQNGLATGGTNPLPGNAVISASRGSPAVTGQTTVSHTAF